MGNGIFETYIGTMTENKDLMIDIKEDLKNKYADIGLTTNKLALRGFEIRDENNGAYKIGRSIFNCKNGILTFPIDHMDITSIIPLQSGQIEIIYKR